MKKLFCFLAIACALWMPLGVNATELLIVNQENEAIAMIEPSDLKNLIVVPVLIDMDRVIPGANNPAAVNLLIGTLYQESTIGGFTHLTQVGGGPGLGPWQIEPNTVADQYVNYLLVPSRRERLEFALSLLSRSELTDKQHEFILSTPDKRELSYDAYSERVAKIMGGEGVKRALVSNLRYQAFTARLKYWRSRFDWPANPNDVEALAVIWDDKYNANPDHGFPHQFVANYPRTNLR